MSTLREIIEQYCESQNKKILSMDISHDVLVKVRVVTNTGKHEKVEKLWFKLSGRPHGMNGVSNG